MDLRAVIFVPALAGSVIFGFVFALFAANYYLNVLQSTGSGARQIVWTGEPILDGFWKVFYLGWMVVFWLGPAFVVARLFAAAGADSVWLRLGVPLAVFWVCYPVSQLSSLSGPTIWLPLHPGVFYRLSTRPGSYLGFMGLSGVALLGLGAGFHWAFFQPGLTWMVLGCLLFVASGLLYGRLLGRLAFVLAFTKPFVLRRKTKAEDEPTDEVPRPPRELLGEPEAPPPVDVPVPGRDDEEDAAFELLNDADAPPPAPRKRIVAQVIENEPPAPAPRPRKKHVDPARDWTDEDEDATPYIVTEAVSVPEPAKPTTVIEPSAEEMKLLSRDDAPKRPKKAWTADVFAYLGQPETWTSTVTLAALCGLAAAMVRVAREFNPVAGVSD